MLKITNLHAAIGDTPILKGLSLAVNADEVWVAVFAWRDVS